MKNIVNGADFKTKCVAFMAEQGLPIDTEVIVDGKIKRYSADGKRNKDEWYIGHEGLTSNNNPYLVVIFGSWSESVKYEFKSWAQNNDLGDHEISELKKILQEQHIKVEQELKLLRENAAKNAQYLWEECKDVALSDEYFRYTHSKKIKPIGGVRFGLNPNGYPALVIPLKNIDGEIRSLQYISVDDAGKNYKRFLSGGEKKGNFHIIGDVADPKGKIFIAEGYATAVSVREATQQPVVIAFDSGNLDSVVENIRYKYPEAQIVIAGDSDDVGKEKAEDAAKKWRCSFVIPSFQQELISKDNTDFNDLYHACGIGEVQKQLNLNVPDVNLQTLTSGRLGNETEPCADFKISHLPLPLQEYIAALCKTTNAHPIMLTSSVLTMVSAFVGTKVFMANGVYYQDLYPNLWILCIAKSGQYKSTALTKGSKIANDKQTQIQKAIKRMQKEAPSDELSAEILKKSLEKVILPTKITAEAFLELLDQGHQGVIYASEFGGWLQNLDKTHNNDFKAILTDFYDVPFNFEYKTKTQGNYIIERPYISICGVSTMPWIYSNLKPSDVPSGFFARFLLFVPPYQEGSSSAFPEPVEEVYIQAEKKFKSCLDNILLSIGESRPMYPTDAARSLVNQYHDYILKLPSDYGDKAGEILQPFTKRWSPTLIKLSMLMQLFEDPTTDQISDVAVMSAMKILMPAMKSTAKLFEEELGESVHQRKCRIILEFMARVQKAGKSITRQTIMSSKQLDGGCPEYDPILQTLIEQGKVECIRHDKKNEWKYILIEKIEEN